MNSDTHMSKTIIDLSKDLDVRYIAMKFPNLDTSNTYDLRWLCLRYEVIYGTVGINDLV